MGTWGKFALNGWCDGRTEVYILSLTEATPVTLTSPPLTTRRDNTGSRARQRQLLISYCPFLSLLDHYFFNDLCIPKYVSSFPGLMHPQCL